MSSRPRRWRSSSPRAGVPGSAAPHTGGARLIADRLLADDSRAAGINVVSGGTDVHLVLVDLRASALDGKQAEDRLHRIGITVNRNAVPFDPRPPMVSSGVRIGTPALAARGFGATSSPRSPTSSPRPCGRPPTEAELDDLRARVTSLAAALPAVPDADGGRAMTCCDNGPPPGAHLPDHPDFLWRNPEPQRSYDVVIVGGGGHGLATAHYLAKNHGITNVAVLERGWLAGGNMARNTTLIRSNYLWDESADLRAFPEAVGRARGRPGLPDPVQPARRAQSRAQPAGRPGQRAPGRSQQAQRHRRRVGRRPTRSRSSARSSTSRQDIRYPVLGATYQPRAGIAKHDYVAWGFARRADEAGIDIIQDCEVTGFVTAGDRVTGVRTTRGRHRGRAGRAVRRRAPPRC